MKKPLQIFVQRRHCSQIWLRCMLYIMAEGLKNIAKRIALLTQTLATELQEMGIELVNENYFDTITFKVNDAASN